MPQGLFARLTNGPVILRGYTADMNLSDHSKRRREENEAAFRSRNQSVKAILDSVLPDENKDDFKLRFTCECSNEQCREVVEVSSADYEQIRRDPRKFIILPGHQQLDIERLVSSDGYAVAEKLEDPPPSDGQLKPTP
jgi:hypothetical protein